MVQLSNHIVTPINNVDRLLLLAIRCEKVPFISTITTVALLILKATTSHKANSPDRFWVYIHKTEFKFFITLLVPVIGNITLFLYRRYRNQNKLYDLSLNTFNPKKEEVLNSIKKDRDILFKPEYKEFQNDLEVVYSAIKANPSLIRFYPLFWNREELVIPAIKENKYLVRLMAATDQFHFNRDIAVKIVNINSGCFALFSKEQRSDIDLALLALKKNCLMSLFIPDEIKKDVKIAKAIQKSEANIANKEQILKAAKEQPSIIKKAISNYGDKLSDDILIELLKIDGLAFQFLSDKQRADRQFVWPAVSQNGLAAQYIIGDLFNQDDEIANLAMGKIALFQNRIDIIISFFKKYPHKVGDMISSQKTVLQKETLIELLKIDGLALQFLSDKQRADRQLVLPAVCQNPLAAGYIMGDLLKQDEEIATIAMRNNPELIKFFPLLRNKIDIVIPVFKKHPHAVENMISLYKGELSDSTLIELLKIDGLALRFLSDAQRADKKFILPAVSQNGLAAEYIMGDLLNQDEEIATIAMGNNPEAMKFFPLLRNKIDIVIPVFKKHPHAVENMISLYNGKLSDSTLIELLKIDGLALRFLSDAQRADKKFVLPAVRQNGLAARYIFGLLNRDSDIAFHAIHQNLTAIIYFPTFWDQKKYIGKLPVEVQVLISNPHYIIDDEFFIKLLENNGLYLGLLNSEQRANKNIVLSAVQENGWAFVYASEALQKDREVIQVALKEQDISNIPDCTEFCTNKRFINFFIKKVFSSIERFKTDLLQIKELENKYTTFFSQIQKITDAIFTLYSNKRKARLVQLDENNKKLLKENSDLLSYIISEFRMKSPNWISDAKTISNYNNNHSIVEELIHTAQEKNDSLKNIKESIDKLNKEIKETIEAIFLQIRMMQNLKDIIFNIKSNNNLNKKNDAELHEIESVFHTYTHQVKYEKNSRLFRLFSK